MKLEKRKGLVRGVIEVEQDRGAFEPIKAYTYWFRHDEPDLEEKLQDAISRLCRAYSYDVYRYSSMACYTEWRDYRG